MRNAYRNSPWHSLLASLDGLTEEEAGWEPSHFKGFPWAKGSIRELVYHVALDKLVQTSCAFGDGALDWAAAWQLPDAKENTLAGALRLLALSHESLLSHLDRLEEARLADKVSTWGGKRMSAEQFFDMLTEHDFYHAGQIRYIRNMLDGGTR